MKKWHTQNVYPFCHQSMCPSPRCPYCFFARTWSLRRTKYKCKKCRREFAATRYPVSGFQLTTEEWFNVAYTFLLQHTIRSLAKELDVSIRYAQKLAHYCRMQMSADLETLFFEGPVEVDETYIGGQRKNKRLHIRRREPSKQGLGTNKLPLFGIFDRHRKIVYVEVLRYTLDTVLIRKRIHEKVAPGTRVYTDGFPRYQALVQDGYLHAFVDHNAGEYARGIVHTNNIEGFWGIMKRKMGCIGGMKRERLELFAREIAWRFNCRNLTNQQQAQILQSLLISS